MTFATQHWVILPMDIPGGADHRSLPFNERYWSLTLSGVFHTNHPGTGRAWNRKTIWLNPPIQRPLTFAAEQSRQSLPPAKLDLAFAYALRVGMWAPRATPTSIFNRNSAVDSGYAVDRTVASPFWTGERPDGSGVAQLWNGTRVDLATSDSDGILYRIAYTLDLVGRIAVVKVGPGFPEPGDDLS